MDERGPAQPAAGVPAARPRPRRDRRARRRAGRLRHRERRAVDGAVTSAAPVTDPAALLDVANTCVLAEEETQGPYWFDVDSIRSDIREGRPGLTLALALRVHDLSSCSVGGAVRPVPNAVVEIWHCDAGGVYSGFATAATA